MSTLSEVQADQAEPTFTRSKGGTAEREEIISQIQVPDLWKIAEVFQGKSNTIYMSKANREAVADAILEIGQRMMAIVPSSAIHDEEGYLLPIISKGRSGRDQKTHIPELLVIDPAHVMPFATGEGCMGNWRGADHSSHLVMTILHEDARNRWPKDYEVGGRHFGVLPPLPMPEEQLAEALGAYGY